MYVIIEAHGDKPVDSYHFPETRRYGEPRVVSMHRTLTAAQRAWEELDAARPTWAEKSDHDYRGILTPHGLVNYHGKKIESLAGSKVQVRMGVYGDD